MHHDNSTNGPRPPVSFYDSKRLQIGLNSQHFIISLDITLVLCLVIPLILVVSTGNADWWWLSKPAPLVMAGLLFMYARYGSMANWWAIVTGHEVKVNRDRLSERERQGESSDAIRQSIAEWTGNCAKGGWVIVNPYRYKFLKKGDAAFFKLAWG